MTAVIPLQAPQPSVRVERRAAASQSAAQKLTLRLDYYLHRGTGTGAEGRVLGD